MRTYREHCHLRPDFEHPFRWCVDFYTATGHWTATNHNLTKQEAIAHGRRCRARNLKLKK